MNGLSTMTLQPRHATVWICLTRSSSTPVTAAYQEHYTLFVACQQLKLSATSPEIYIPEWSPNPKLSSHHRTDRDFWKRNSGKLPALGAQLKVGD